ncbi:hypothetical protein HDU67_002601 [Dinochytrium kinnereticum]|nr:hypothetical protein HDU67_002601 [Dinochytrium kinnereticum]
MAILAVQLLLWVLAASLVIQTACAQSQAPKVQLPIGILFPYSHPSVNNSNRPALDLMAWKINNSPKLSIPGAEIVLRWRDSLGTLAGSVSGAIDLAVQSNAVGLVGEWVSGRTGPAAAALNRFQVFQCSSSSDPTFSDKSNYKYHFRIVPSDDAQGRLMALFVKRFGWSQVAIIAVNSGYGLGCSSFFLKEAKLQNITVLTSVSYSSQQTTFKPQMQSIVTSGARIIVYAGYDTDFVRIYRDAKEVGLVGPKYVWMGSDGLEAILDVVTSYSDEVSVRDLDGLIISTYPTPGEGAEFNDFKNRYIAAYRSVPSTWGLFHSDCLLVLSQGLRRMLSMGFSLQQITSRRTNISLSDFIAFSLNGTTGPIVFNSNGDRLSGYIYKNLYGGVVRDFATADFYGNFTFFRDVLFSGGQKKPPRDGLDPTLDELETNSTFSLALLGACGVGFLLVLLSVVVICRKRTSFTVKITSFPFLLIASAGIAIEYLSVVCTLLNFRNISRVCAVDAWLGWLGYALFVQGYLPKLLRLYMVCNKSSVHEDKMRFVKDNVLLPCSSILPFLNIVTLSLWTFYPGMDSVQIDGISPDTYHHECKSSRDLAFIVTLLTFNGIHLLFLCLLAHQTRKVPIPFQENSFILYACELILIAAIVVLALQYTNSGYVFTMRLRVLLTFLCTFAAFLLTIGRVVISTIFENQYHFTLLPAAEAETMTVARKDAAFLFLKDRCQASILVKNSTKVFATWKPCTLVFYFKSRLLVIVDQETNMGPTAIVTESTILDASAIFPNCAEVRMGDSYLLLFDSKSSLNTFLETAGVMDEGDGEVGSTSGIGKRSSRNEAGAT